MGEGVELRELAILRASQFLYTFLHFENTRTILWQDGPFKRVY